MEDTLRVVAAIPMLAAGIVLILVLMEDTLRVAAFAAFIIAIDSLNPCFNGRYSLSNCRGLFQARELS